MRVPFLDLRAAYQELKPEIDAAYHRVMDSGWYILGQELEQFERELAEYCGAKHCLGVANGLDALTLILRAMEIGPGHEVIVPAHTFIATWLAVSACGATPVPVDVDATCNLDPTLVERAITSRTRAIMPVHLYGQPADVTALGALAKAHGLHLIEDAAQAHGSTLHGRPTGGLADAAGFSFYPGKNLGAFGDGGAITTNDAELCERLRKLRNYGSTVKYQHDIEGTNSRLDELQAAFLRVRLRVLDAWNARRQRIAERYTAALCDLPSVRLPARLAGAVSTWHLFVIEVDDRARLISRLAERGVSTLVHYPVEPAKSGAYSGNSYPAMPVAARLAATVLSLPMGPHLSDAQVDHTIAALCASL